MPTVKFFEVRDRGTLIPVMAIRPDTVDPVEKAILARGGFSRPENYVLLIRLIDHIEIQHNPWAWRFGRTMLDAHRHILGNFDRLSSGQGVDVEFILGESAKAKESAIDL